MVSNTGIFFFPVSVLSKVRGGARARVVSNTGLCSFLRSKYVFVYTMLKQSYGEGHGWFRTHPFSKPALAISTTFTGVCACMYVYVYTYIYVYIYIYILCVCIYVYVCMHVCK